ncbi:50S ribosomal protein L4 [Gordonibacter sp. 28C]|uniref:50S ribosomal protein L4 n=1 Tax=Gordonibacter sp. 28C TaxID=2078569 RepID=UPI000DF7835A|nr:50S ribosomal protein L4 [Gordonibacter sp. 28C]RDB63760.1 50S ribosomal protein L4 [Gordonibacter sp. 28C]
MTTIEIKDASGKKAGSADLAASVFGIEPNVPVMHTVVRSQRAAWRQGTSNTLTRGQVRGGGKKPWRQKGTGRARQGTIRAPQWAGGGTVFGPHPRSYAFRVNNKEVKLAMRSALSAKLADDELVIVEGFKFEKPSTKAAVAAMKALGLEGRVTLVIADDDVNTYLSFRNIPKVNIIPVSEINTYELIDNKKLVVTADALKYIEEVLA